MVHNKVTPHICSIPHSYGSAVPAIHIDTLGMDDFEARILTIEFDTLWVVCCYAPATADEEK